MQLVSAKASVKPLAAYEAGQREGIGNCYNRICNGPMQNRPQQLQLHAGQCEGSGSRHATGQQEGIGSYHSCICNEPMRSHWQSLPLHMRRVNAKASAAAATAYAIGHCKGICSSCSCLWANTKPLAVATASYTTGESEISAAVAATYAVGRCEGIRSNCCCLRNGPMRSHP